MFSPFHRTPVSSVKGQILNKSSHFFSPSIRRTPSSRNASMSRSFMNSILDETMDHSIERYGCTLPVLVTEALTIADRITDISVKLEPFGYASLVCGRHLLVWKYKQDEKTVHCKELTLPPSDLAHKAELVHLFQTEDSKLPSALAVSPEGHVRYWPNINHEGSSVDAQPDLQGQECCSLSSIYPLGCVLATTSSSLIIITPTIDEGQPSVICRTLTLPMGVLAGIGRKVSSFIFGVIPSQTSETKQLNRVLSVRTDDDDYFLYVLSNSNLQKWHITRKDRKENIDELVFEVDIDRELKQSYSKALLNNDTNLIPNLKTWCLDMQLCQSGVMILTLGTAPGSLNDQVNYALGTLDTSSDEPPEKFTSFHLTGYTETYQEENEENLLSYKFLLPSVDSVSAYMYNSLKVLCVPAAKLGTPQAEHSEVDFSTTNNFILGSGSCEGMSLFFTKDFGVISFSPSQKLIEDSRILSTIKDVSIRNTDPNEPPDGLSAKIRLAMCSYCNNDLEKCDALMREIIAECRFGEEVNLDEAVVNLSLGIIDDFPVSDPRWCESIPAGSVSSSLLISYQLEDKLKVHDCLLVFLNNFKIFEKLTSFRVGDVKVPTNVLLCEHAEKLVAAKSLRLFTTEHNDVIELAVRDSLDRRDVEIMNHLTPQDVFFREVSAFHTIFPSLIEWEREQLNADESLGITLNVIMTTNKICVRLLEAVNEYRESRKNSYGLKDSEVDFVPWTSRDGNSGIRSHIRNQLVINIDHGLKLIDNVQIQFVLFQQYVELLNFYLNSFQAQLKAKTERSKTLKKEYEKERNLFIQPLLSVQQYERAASIAEKYLDFDLLIQICEETKDTDRLQRYMLQFTEQNFSEFVFKWYLDKGQKGKIFDKHLGQREVLGNFLQEHNGLKWIYFIQEEKYAEAHATLKQLALKETQFLSRKKTLLSLSKLCALVSDTAADIKSSQIEALNMEMDLIAHQEALSLSVVEAYGLDPHSMRVFSPEELIEMYISDENFTANSFDFKIALDLLSFIKKPLDDADVYNLRMRIWSKSILRSSWENLDINNPLEAIKETTFFQIIELAFDEGVVDMHEFIPHIEDLLRSPDLEELSENPSFQFLLQAGYEHILKIIA